MPPDPELFARLIDDAACFPPGNLPLEEALVAHAEHRGADYGDLVGPFVVSDHGLPDAVEAGFPVAVVAGGGAGGVAGILGLCARRGTEVAALEIAVRDLDDPAGNVRRIVAALDAARADGTLSEHTTTYVELPAADPGGLWLRAADEVAAADLALKFRTGGVAADAFPTPARLAAWIDAALDRELPFKCTAGLHHAVAHTDPDTGFEHHGFLNVLLASRAALDHGLDAAEAALTMRAPERVAEAVSAVPVSTRRWFRSFGSCEIAEPVQDLVSLGLIGR